jgi:hypothetical protein
MILEGHGDAGGYVDRRILVDDDPLLGVVDAAPGDRAGAVPAAFVINLRIGVAVTERRGQA